MRRGCWKQTSDALRFRVSQTLIGHGHTIDFCSFCCSLSCCCTSPERSPDHWPPERSPENEHQNKTIRVLRILIGRLSQSQRLNGGGYFSSRHVPAVLILVMGTSRRCPTGRSCERLLSRPSIRETDRGKRYILCVHTAAVKKNEAFYEIARVQNKICSNEFEVSITAVFFELFS